MWKHQSHLGGKNNHRKQREAGTRVGEWKARKKGDRIRYRKRQERSLEKQDNE